MLVPDNRNGLTESTPISSIEHNSMVELSDDGNHHRSPREAQEKAKDIIRADLDAQFRGKVRFGSIRITPRPGPDDEEYLDVLVVYDGRREDLQAQVLNSLYERIGDDLRVIGIDKTPSISYRDKTEDSEWSDLVRVSSFGQ